MNGAPIGRSPEWRSFVDWLKGSSSGLLVIQGEPGSGRTHLLRSFGEHAQGQGFVVAGCFEQLPIESTTQVSDISRALAALLGVETRGPREAHGVLSGFFEGIKVGYHEERDLHTILNRPGRLLIGIDGYLPSRRMEQWILGPFLTWIKGIDRSIVLVIVDRAERLVTVRESADLILTLGALHRDELRQYFTAISQSLEPPLAHEEIECYTEASSGDPTIFSALDTVLLATNLRDVT
jgi:hypothetical protein